MNRIGYTTTIMGIGAISSLVGGSTIGQLTTRTLAFGAISYFILWPVFLQ
jgi:hypothetical protein|tara:strand:+ start:6896 stop:7045 length:150 start_codon:yes stop_codon:yes gene_type:complete